ncbi:hypothetical protein M758_8G168300 [Ceratodon purpureus]|nr:hypothetical protein M758_8G168300 [Ceratodon purpureus]
MMPTEIARMKPCALLLEDCFSWYDLSSIHLQTKIFGLGITTILDRASSLLRSLPSQQHPPTPSPHLSKSQDQQISKTSIKTTYSYTTHPYFTSPETS